MTPVINHSYIDFVKPGCLNTHMHKIACVFSFRESSWISCQKIVFNLHKAYEELPNCEIRNFHYGMESKHGELHRLTYGIHDWTPDTIVIMDHKPHPLAFLKFLLPLYEGKKKPRIVFHVFGDFTLYYQEWAKLGGLLRGFPVDFIVASDRQKILIDKFLEKDHGCHVVPFPVRTEDFSFKKEERIRQRKEWGVEDNDLVFAFTGRISRQKRTHLLLSAFKEAVESETSRKAHLFIYGLADNVADNFLNIWESENEYFRRIHRQYMELPENIRNRVHFMGNVPNSDLRPVYAGADVLVTLSVHNDEDFGMSVAEAQMCGLPSILTDWGGLASFEHPQYPEATKYLKVSIGKTSKIISKKATIESMKEAIRNTKPIDREKLIALSQSRFSVLASGQDLKAVFKKDAKIFSSFSAFHAELTRRVVVYRPMFTTRFHKIRPLYRELYSAYVRNP